MRIEILQENSNKHEWASNGFFKKGRSIKLIIPKLFKDELDKYLDAKPPEFKYEISYFYYFVNYISSRANLKRNGEYAVISSIKLRRDTVYNINKYIDVLIGGGFIETKDCRVGISSRAYKVNPDYCVGFTTIELNPRSRLSKKLVKRLSVCKANYSKLDSHLKLMNNKFRKIEFDYEGALQWISNNSIGDKTLSYLLSLLHLYDKRFRYFKRNGTNKRLDTNLTNLKSDLRSFIKGDYVSIDLKNSQPFFLGQLLNTITNPTRYTLCCRLDKKLLVKTFGVKAIEKIYKIHKKYKIEENMNLRTFNISVIDGSLYDKISKYCPKELTRDQIKTMIFKVLYSSDEKIGMYKSIILYSKEKKMFESVYPFVNKALGVLKEKDHRQISIYLQRLESYIFIDCIAKELCEAGIVPLTIHDSVIVESEHQKKALEIIYSVFMKNFGVIPSFHFKSLKE